MAASPPSSMTSSSGAARGPYLELFARSPRPGWTVWGDEAETYQTPDNLYSRQSEAVGWRLFEKPEADAPIVDSPTTL